MRDTKTNRMDRLRMMRIWTELRDINQKLDHLIEQFREFRDRN